MSDIRIFCDRGGTFCDLVAEYVDNTGKHCNKVLKLLSVNPSSYKDAATEGIRRLLEDITGDVYPQGEPINSSRLSSIRMGTTVATNALLERKGTPVVFVTTSGLEDVMTIGTQARPDIFALNIKLPEKIYQELISAEERVIVVPLADTYNTIDEFKLSYPDAEVCTSSSGEHVFVLMPLNVQHLRHELQIAYNNGLRSCAIAFAHSYAYPQHEIIAGNIAREIGYTHVSLSHQIISSVKLLNRAYTTCADAYLTPVLQDYIQGFINGFDQNLFKNTEVLFMQSDGGLTDVSNFTGFKSILSGPAGGFVGFSQTAVVTSPEVTSSSSLSSESESSNKDDDTNQDSKQKTPQQSLSDPQQIPRLPHIDQLVLSISSPQVLQTPLTRQDLLGLRIPAIGVDIGGTSADISLSSSDATGQPDYIYENTISGIVISATCLDINTVASGGGSILQFKQGLYTAGPESAGSYPGPACYGVTNTAQLTVTDANCIVGKINPKYFPYIFGPQQDKPLNKDIAIEKFDEMAVQINEWRLEQHKLRHDTVLASLSSSSTPTTPYIPLSREEIALGFLSIANESICRPIRALTDSRGIDIRTLTLSAFGGACGQSACMIANNLGITAIHIHNLTSVLSAYGIGLANITAEKIHLSNTYITDDNSISAIYNTFNDIVPHVINDVMNKGIKDKDNITSTVHVMLKYKGTDTTLQIEITDYMYSQIVDIMTNNNHNTDIFISTIKDIFITRYLKEFGFVLERPIIMESIIIRAKGNNTITPVLQNDCNDIIIPQPVEYIDCYMINPSSTTMLSSTSTSTSTSTSDVDPDIDPGSMSTSDVDPACNTHTDNSNIIHGKWYKTPLYMHNTLYNGTVIPGPAIIIDTNSTIVVEPQWVAFILHDSIVLLKQDHNIDNNNNTNSNTDTATGAANEVASTTATTVVSSSSSSINNMLITTIEQAIQYVPCQPILLSLLSHRFMSIAEQMGKTLQRTSISTNIKERLDFSCAIFNGDGDLICNAPNLPVHLGSMSSCIKAQIDIVDVWYNGDVIVTNSPNAGGSHLPDITIITPLFIEPYTPGDKPIFFTASRGHHSDVGGITPGSMPAFSKSLCQEGVEIISFKIVKGNAPNGPTFDSHGIETLLTQQSQCGHSECRGTRNLVDNISDLLAQISANNRGIKLLNSLISTLGLSTVTAYMLYIQRSAEDATRELLKEAAKKAKIVSEQQAQKDAQKEDILSSTSSSLYNSIETSRLLLPYSSHKYHDGKAYDGKLPVSIDYMDDGTPIVLQIYIDTSTGNALFDFTGTGPQVLSNINTPMSVVYSAIIYSLRSLIGHNIPLNQGTLVPITVYVPPYTILSPSIDAATVGGNVLTSCRITDVVLTAFQCVAQSQGCMNNFTFGSNLASSNTFGYYETICGGSGAGDGYNGTTAHTNMTNTMITDVEILERKYPALLRQWRIRQSSGGSGQWYGGCGVIREVEFLSPHLTVNILSERRSYSPRGIQGGTDGQRGANYMVKYNNTMYDIYKYNTLDGIDPLHQSRTLISLGGKNTFHTNSLNTGGARVGIRILTPGGGGYGYKTNKSNNNDNNNKSIEVRQQHASTSISTQIGSVAHYLADQERV